MLIVILALGGAILGATTIAGLLMTYQIRATTDSQHSAQAVFAADAGVEWALFDYYCDATSSANPVSRCVAGPREQPALTAFGNGATSSVICYDQTGVTEVLCSETSTAATAIAKGSSLDSRRAFLLDLTGFSTPLP